MTARRPAGVSWDSWTDQQINSARAQGAFDDLPHKGKPLPGLDQPHDEMWWVRDLMRREDLSFLPETLQLRRDVERALEALPSIGSRDVVERRLRTLNARIIEVNRSAVDGPPSTTPTIDVERALDRWAARRASVPTTPASITAPGAAAEASRQRLIAWAVVGGLALLTVLAFALGR